MTVDDAVIEQTLREFCATEDKVAATHRISIWLAVARREGAEQALRDAAEAWRKGRPSLVGRWLTARAEALGGQL